MKRVRDEIRFFRALVKGIAAQFGPICEVVLHDYDRPVDRTIIAIENGQVTNRKIGDCATNFSLQTIRGKKQQADRYNYATQTKEGRVLRSSTVYIRDDEGKPIGSICINLDITDMLMAVRTIQGMAHIENKQESQEVFGNDVNGLLESLIAESIEHVGVPVALMDKAQKVCGLKYLDKKGALLIKKAGDKIAKAYDISKFTIYNYLEE